MHSYGVRSFACSWYDSRVQYSLSSLLSKSLNHDSLTRCLIPRISWLLYYSESDEDGMSNRFSKHPLHRSVSKVLTKLEVVLATIGKILNRVFLIECKKQAYICMKTTEK